MGSEAPVTVGIPQDARYLLRRRINLYLLALVTAVTVVPGMIALDLRPGGGRGVNVEFHAWAPLERGDQ